MNKIMSAYAVGALGAVVAISVLLQYAEAQKPHVVGDNQGWRIPSSDDPSLYEKWAKAQKFSVGDILTFNFTTSQHNVVEVPKESYDSCSANNSTSINANGPANITLHSSGKHYFICSFRNGAHCQGGQKLAIDVSSSADSPTSPDGPPPPSSAPITSAFAGFFLLSLASFMVVMF